MASLKDISANSKEIGLKHLHTNLKILRDFSLYPNYTKEEAINAYKSIKKAYTDGTYEKYAKQRCPKLGFPFA